MISEINLVILILIILLIITLYNYKKNKKCYENFEYVISNKDNSHYLTTDGKKFFLYDKTIPFKKKNALIFLSLQDVEDYFKKKYPSLSINNLKIYKNNEDPKDSYNKICSKEIASFNLNLDKNTNPFYGLNLTPYKFNNALNNYNIEKCMIKKLLNES